MTEKNQQTGYPDRSQVELGKKTQVLLKSEWIQTGIKSLKNTLRINENTLKRGFYKR